VAGIGVSCPGAAGTATRFGSIATLTFYILAGVFGWALLLLAISGLPESSLGLRRRIGQS
jgi:hypothetical protein